MAFEVRKSMAWMEHGLQISLKRYALMMEDKMEAGGFGCARNYDEVALIFTGSCVGPACLCKILEFSAFPQYLKNA